MGLLSAAPHRALIKGEEEDVSNHFFLVYSFVRSFIRFACVN